MPTRARRAKQRAAAFGLWEGEHFTDEEWLELLASCGHRCLRCGASGARVELSADHVVPLSLGGANSITNVQPLYVPCNTAKGGEVRDYRGCGASVP